MSWNLQQQHPHGDSQHNSVKPAAQEAEERSDTQVHIYIYSLAILSSQIDVCAAAVTQAQTHKKRETEKATKQ
jgi:TRAP-type C4-dicarboxylate transport system substrate-binding protein